MGSMGVFLFLVAGGALYYNYVVSHQAYVIDRNFRLLAMHGELIVDTVKNLKQVFQSAIKARELGPTTQSSEKDNLEQSPAIQSVAKKEEGERYGRLKILEALQKSPWLNKIKVFKTSPKSYAEKFEFYVNPSGARSIFLEYQPRLEKFTHLDYRNAPALWEKIYRNTNVKYRWLKNGLSLNPIVKFYLDELSNDEAYLSVIMQEQTANELLELGMNAFKEEIEAMSSVKS